jgi:YggT family protein
MDTYTVTTRPVYSGIRIIWYIVDVLEVLLVFRFFLKLFGANPAAGFTNFIYQTTYSFAYPFLGVFSSTPVTNGRGIFEWNSLLAMLVYYLIALVIIRLFLLDRTVTTSDAVVKHY